MIKCNCRAGIFEYLHTNGMERIEINSHSLRGTDVYVNQCGNKNMLCRHLPTS